jgi:hypothetical protein
LYVRLLDTAKGTRGLRNEPGVGADHANLQGLGHSPDPSDVPGEEVPGKTKLGVIRLLDDLLLGLKLDDWREGTKRLLLHDDRIVGNVDQDGRLVESPLASLAANQGLCTFGQGVLDVLVDLGSGFGVDQRAVGAVNQLQ